MKWIKASERLPADIKKWYLVRQESNTRSAKAVWWEHIHGNVDGSLKLPLCNIEWLDETTPEGWVGEGINLIAEERKRQVEVEGWTPEHDAEHDEGDLAIAAACYALTPVYNKSTKKGDQSPKNWPWDENWWKPSPNDRIRELVKAGALIAAEIDRLKNDSPTP